MPNVNKKYKDRLFRMVFSRKEDLLELYNAVNNSRYSDPEEFEIETIDDIIYMGMKNDVAFMIDDIMNLWEHQSTWNPNMPLRGLFYMADEYRKFVKRHGWNLYGSRLVEIPLPQYFIFYNGMTDEPDRMELKLSDAFSKRHQGLVPCVELKAVMLNINIGHNRQLMERCRKLWEYSQFVFRVRREMNVAKSVEQAVENVVKSCIEEGILREFLQEHRAEVEDVVLNEYDEQKHIADEKKVSREEGYQEGKMEGYVRLVRIKRLKGYDALTIAEELELDENLVKEIYRLIDEYPDFSDLQIADYMLNIR